MAKNIDIAIRVTNISKTFHPQSSSKTLKESFVGLGRKLQGKKRLTIHKGDYTALRNIEFDVKEGEFFGIVGRNGSGKSTLLKILAGVYTPSSGSVHVNGKLTPFIELGVGFNPELSGRDNVFLNGALLGFTRRQMEAMYDDIVDFAELHDFMDTKLKNYSSGMQVRLAFSVAIRAKSDVLLIDEVLAVGDTAFQKKCFDYFDRLKKSGATIIFVSHDMESVRKYCNRAMLIHKGDMVAVGDVFDITAKYTQLNQLIVPIGDNEGPKLSRDFRITTHEVKVIGSTIEFRVKFAGSRKRKEAPLLGISLLSESGEYLVGFNNMNMKQKAVPSQVTEIVSVIEDGQLLPGNYFVNYSLYSEEFDLIDFVARGNSFSIKKPKDLSRDGKFNIKVRWQ